MAAQKKTCRMKTLIDMWMWMNEILQGRTPRKSHRRSMDAEKGRISFLQWGAPWSSSKWSALNRCTNNQHWKDTVGCVCVYVWCMHKCVWYVSVCDSCVWVCVSVWVCTCETIRIKEQVSNLRENEGYGNSKRGRGRSGNELLKKLIKRRRRHH